MTVKTMLFIFFKALFCLVLSYCLSMIIFGHISAYLGIALPVWLIALVGAAVIFVIFSRIEQARGK